MICLPPGFDLSRTLRNRYNIGHAYGTHELPGVGSACGGQTISLI